jgi:hypothetical protein
LYISEDSINQVIVESKAKPYNPLELMNTVRLLCVIANKMSIHIHYSLTSCGTRYLLRPQLLTRRRTSRQSSPVHPFIHGRLFDAQPAKMTRFPSFTASFTPLKVFALFSDIWENKFSSDRQSANRTLSQTEVLRDG